MQNYRQSNKRHPQHKPNRVTLSRRFVGDNGRECPEVENGAEFHLHHHLERRPSFFVVVVRSLAFLAVASWE